MWNREVGGNIEEHRRMLTLRLAQRDQWWGQDNTIINRGVNSSSVDGISQQTCVMNILLQVGAREENLSGLRDGWSIRCHSYIPSNSAFYSWGWTSHSIVASLHVLRMEDIHSTSYCSEHDRKAQLWPSRFQVTMAVWWKFDIKSTLPSLRRARVSTTELDLTGLRANRTT